MIVVKSPSVWMIHLNSTHNYPAEWINLAAVEQIIYLENEETIHIRFSSGKMQYYRGEQAKMLRARTPNLSRSN
jgi:hypothetical protein